MFKRGHKLIKLTWMDLSRSVYQPKTWNLPDLALSDFFLVAGVVVIVQSRCPRRVMLVVVEVASLVEVQQLLEFAARSWLLLLVDVHHCWTKQQLLLLFAR